MFVGHSVVVRKADPLQDLTTSKVGWKKPDLLSIHAPETR